MGDDARVRCPGCRGKGSWARGDVCGECKACVQNPLRMACLHHLCRRCHGSGLVCPECCGDRFVRKDVPVGHPDFGEIFRCKSCCEGNNVNAALERKHINKYLATYRPDTRTAWEMEEERQRTAAEHYADYVARHGRPQGALKRRAARSRRRGDGGFEKLGDVLEIAGPNLRQRK